MNVDVISTHRFCVDCHETKEVVYFYGTMRICCECNNKRVSGSWWAQPEGKKPYRYRKNQGVLDTF